MSRLIDHINPVGKPPKYKKPKDLWNKFVEYVDWVDSNPIELPIRMNLKGSQKQIESRTEDKVTAKRPYTLTGFCMFANIWDWSGFKLAECRHTEEYRGVIRAIEDAIKDQQISGAMVGLYNSNLTARLNGITDKTDITTNGKDLNPQVEPKTKEQIENELRRLGYK